MNDPLVIAGVEYKSRLLVGTGKYTDLEETRLATEASCAEIITVAIFTMEYLLRVLVSDRKLRFIFSFYGMVDLFAILPVDSSQTHCE